MPARLSATKIRAKMQTKNISPSVLTQRSTLSESTVGRIINGHATSCSDHTAACIANALDCTIMEILDDEYIAPVIANTVATSVETALVEAVAGAVSVIVDDVAPKTPAASVADTMPDMRVHLPPALDVAAYFTYIQNEHNREMEELRELHREHMNDIRIEKNVWRSIALSAIAIIVVCTIVLFVCH